MQEGGSLENRSDGVSDHETSASVRPDTNGAQMNGKHHREEDASELHDKNQLLVHDSDSLQTSSRRDEIHHSDESPTKQEDVMDSLSPAVSNELSLVKHIWKQSEKRKNESEQQICKRCKGQVTSTSQIALSNKAKDEIMDRLLEDCNQMASKAKKMVRFSFFYAYVSNVMTFGTKQSFRQP